MSVQSPPLFGRGTPVHAYWLEHCVGFEVIDEYGRELGTVTDLERRRGGLELVVGRLRPRTLTPELIAAVDPHRSLLLLDGASDSAGARHEDLASEERPGWQDETLAWWEVLEQAEAPKPLREPMLVNFQRAVELRLHTGRQTVLEHGRRGYASLAGAVRTGVVGGVRAGRRTRAQFASAVHTGRKMVARALIRLAARVDPAH